MTHNHQDYSTTFPDVSLKIYTVPVSLRRHLYMFKTLTGVFSYKKLDLGTKVLVDHMIIPNKPSVLLDLGCGYGVIGIVLAYESPFSSVYFIDVNNRAIWCTRENVRLNLSKNKGKYKIYAGNYFNPIEETKVMFDAIYMNPPLRKGRKEFLDLFTYLPNYLKPNGSFQFVIKKKMGSEYVYKYLLDRFSDNNIKVLCKRSGYWVFYYNQI
ncbi:MAG: class I SAM-dependent methyltransferase [Candidatus Lokiarchaeota archaeon]|nr:class I SAM-dependent methyltransferase [Candidatus Lokiarchaeota archaeon]